MKKSRPERRLALGCATTWDRRTDDQALHFVFPHNLNLQSILDLVVIFEGAAARGHDAKVRWSRAVDDFVLELQFAEEVDTLVDARRLEFQEV